MALKAQVREFETTRSTYGDDIGEHIYISIDTSVMLPRAMSSTYLNRHRCLISL